MPITCASVHAADDGDFGQLSYSGYAGWLGRMQGKNACSTIMHPIAFSPAGGSIHPTNTRKPAPVATLALFPSAVFPANRKAACMPGNAPVKKSFLEHAINEFMRRSIGQELAGNVNPVILAGYDEIQRAIAMRFKLLNKQIDSSQLKFEWSELSSNYFYFSSLTIWLNGASASWAFSINEIEASACGTPSDGALKSIIDISRTLTYKLAADQAIGD